MFPNQMARLKAALTNQNLSSAKRAVLQTAFNVLSSTSLTATTSLLDATMGGIVDDTPASCTRVINTMLNSLNKWDPLFLQEVNKTLQLARSENENKLSYFIDPVRKQNNIQVNLFISGLVELSLVFLAISGAHAIDNHALKILWMLLTITLFVTASSFFSVHLQSANKDHIVFQYASCSEARERLTMAATTISSLVSNFIFNRTNISDQSGKDNLKYIIGSTGRWLPRSLSTVCDGAVSLAKQHLSAASSPSTLSRK